MSQDISVGEIESRLLYLKHRYYNFGDSGVSDSEYDQLESDLREAAPESPILKMTGAPPSPSAWEKREHSFHAGSLEKAKTLEELRDWASKFPSDTKYHVSQKLDGLSIIVYSDGGVPKHAVTRGDGKLGEDVFNNFCKLSNLPNPGRFPPILRGEITLDHASFEEHFEGYSNPRNAAAGTLRDLQGGRVKYLSVFFYEARDADGEAFLSRQRMFEALSQAKLPIAPDYGVMSIDELISKYPEIEASRGSLGYDIDGLVIWVEEPHAESKHGLNSSNNPVAAIALKFPDEEKTGKIKDIRWDLGLGGRLTPVAILEEPVNLAGANISHVSLHNLDQLLLHQVTIGSEIGVIRSGEVIPYMTRKISGGEDFWLGHPADVKDRDRFYHHECSINLKALNFPSTCPECGSDTDLIDAYVYCTSRDCDGFKKGRILKWVTSLGLKQIGEGLIEGLVKQGIIEDAGDLYSLTVEDVQSVDRKSDKHFEKMRSALDSKKTLTFPEFMGALGIPYAGPKVWRNVESSGISTLRDLKWSGPQELAKAERLGLPRATEIYQELGHVWPVITKLVDAGIKIKEPATGGKLYGKSFCITGSLKVEVEGKKVTKGEFGNLLEEAGAKMESGVTKDLDFLILSDPNSTSGKAQKAQKMGVALVSPEEVLGMLV